MILEDSSIAPMTRNNDSPWLVLVTRPNHERTVFRYLTQVGIPVLLPLRKEMRKWSDRRKKFEIPYFPNYLFVNVALIERYQVFESPGAVRYLDSNSNPSVLNDKDMDIIRKLNAGDENLEVTTEVFDKGDIVTITSGAFKNYNAVLVEKKGTKRLLIRLESIHRSLLLDVPAASMHKLPPAQQRSLPRTIATGNRVTG